MAKQIVKLNEEQLHQIVKETVQRVLNEAYSDAQYAHLAGQANGALNSPLGKVRGFFDKGWKNRKERQMDKFARRATGQRGDDNQSTKGGGHNFGRTSIDLPGSNGGYNQGKRDYIGNHYNTKNKENPFEIQRYNYEHGYDINGNRYHRNLPHDKEVLSKQEVLDMAKERSKAEDYDKWQEYLDLSRGNSQLNNAYRQGQNARKGGTYKNYRGEKFTNDTGTGSDMFKRLKEDIDMGQVSSWSDREVRKNDRANFNNRPEIISARKELHRLRCLIDDIETKGGDITPIRQKIQNIKDHYFDGNYIWHLQRGDKWDDSTGWSN